MLGSFGFMSSGKTSGALPANETIILGTSVLFPNGGTHDLYGLGKGVGINGAGTNIILGAPDRTSSGTKYGAVALFVEDGGVWEPHTIDAPSGGNIREMGSDVQHAKTKNRYVAVSYNAINDLSDQITGSDYIPYTYLRGAFSGISGLGYNAAGTAATTIQSNALRGPAISPDGDTIFYRRYDNNMTYLGITQLQGSGWYTRFLTMYGSSSTQWYGTGASINSNMVVFYDQPDMVVYSVIYLNGTLNLSLASTVPAPANSWYVVYDSAMTTNVLAIIYADDSLNYHIALYDKSGSYSWSNLQLINNVERPYKIVISEDESTIAIGYALANKVEIYKRPGSVWEYQGYLEPSLGVSNFGLDLDISSNGSKIVVGSLSSRAFIYDLL